MGQGPNFHAHPVINPTQIPRPDHLGLIAGKGIYPLLVVKAARAAGVSRISLVAFDAETDPALRGLADDFVSLRVGQLGKLLGFFKEHGVAHALMAGQISPKHLFDLKPDLRALVLLAKLKERNAETIFGAIADELARNGTELLPATTFLEDALAPAGHFAGPALGRKEWADAEFGFRIAKESARLDIGQSVVVRRGTVLAVEAFEGTDAAMRRGGPLGKGSATLAKVSKPGQDFRFDVPVVGPQTLQTAREAGISVIACEAGRTLLLDREQVVRLAKEFGIGMAGLPQAQALH